MLWASLAAAVGLRAVAVQWRPIQSIVGTADLSTVGRSLAAGVEASVFLLDESRQLTFRLVRSLFRKAYPE